MPVQDRPPPPPPGLIPLPTRAIVQQSVVPKPPTDFYRHTGDLQGLQSPRVPTAPNPLDVFSPEGLVKLTLKGLSEAHVPTNLFQRVESRLQDWAKAENASQRKNTIRSSVPMTIAIKELTALDPVFVLTNRDSLGAATIGSSSVAKIAAFALGAQGRVGEVSASILSHPTSVSSHEAELAANKLLPYGVTTAPKAVVDKIGGWASESLNAAVIAESLRGFISTHTNAPRALGEQVLAIPQEHRAGVLWSFEAGFRPELLEALNEDPLKSDPVSKAFIISRVKAAPKLALRSPVAEELPGYASEALFGLSPVVLLDLHAQRQHLSPRFTNELSQALNEKKTLFNMIPGNNSNIEALMRDPKLSAFESSLRLAIEKVPGRAALLNNRFAGNLKSYLEQLPPDKRSELVEGAVRISRLTSQIWAPGAVSIESYVGALGMAQKAVRDIAVFEGRQVIVIANNEVLGDPRTTGSTIRGRIWSFVDGVTTKDSHRFGKKGASDAISVLSGRAVQLFRGEENDSRHALETIKTNALKAIIEAPPGPNGLVVLFDTHGSPTEQFLSNGTVDSKGAIVRGENPVSISMLELQKALEERSKRYPEPASLHQRTIILIGSCMSLKFAEDIAEGSFLNRGFVSPFVAAAAERGQFGYSITESPVGSDFLAHTFRLGSCVSGDGKVLHQPTLGDLDKPGPDAISNPALFAPYSIIRGMTGETNRLVPRDTFQVF